MVFLYSCVVVKYVEQCMHRRVVCVSWHRHSHTVCPTKDWRFLNLTFSPVGKVRGVRLASKRKSREVQVFLALWNFSNLVSFHHSTGIFVHYFFLLRLFAFAIHLTKSNQLLWCCASHNFPTRAEPSSKGDQPNRAGSSVNSQWVIHSIAFNSIAVSRVTERKESSSFPLSKITYCTKMPTASRKLVGLLKKKNQNEGKTCSYEDCVAAKQTPQVLLGSWCWADSPKNDSNTDANALPITLILIRIFWSQL